MRHACSFLLVFAACSTGSPATGNPDANEPPIRLDAQGSRDPDAATAPPDAQPDATVAQTAAGCFEGVFTNEVPDGPDYDQFNPVVGSHCKGTNHQDISGVERVVFVGDSVTVGTPPTDAGDFFRSRLAAALASRFGLEPPGSLWEQVNPLEGTSLLQTSGDFASCAKWGARTDDLLQDNSQLLDCFPAETRTKRTLVIMTMGGNDISNITQAGLDGEPIDAIWTQTQQFVDLLRQSVAWLREPGRFPNGVYVVFANMYEFTDGTGDLESCEGAAAAGYGGEWEDPGALADLVIWANEQFLSIAVDSGSDMIFMLESFCGHGFNHDDPNAPCYRGPGTERWFDLTCIHPNPTGHQAIADMFLAVVDE